MNDRPNDPFTKILERDLADLGRALASELVPETLLAEVLIRLGALPPQTVIPGEGKIPKLAALYTAWSPDPAPRRPALTLLRSEPRLALLFLFHRDGYVREAALDSFGPPPSSPFFLAALVLRLNDWVVPVRAAAHDCAARVFPVTSAAVVAGAAPFLLDRWRRWRRWGKEGAALVDGMLQRPDVTACLVKERFAKRIDGPLARELKYALRGRSVDPYLPLLAREAKHPAVRATALQALVRARASWPVRYRQEWIDKTFGRFRRATLFAERPLTIERGSLDQLIRDGLRDRSSLVRRVAVDALIEHRATFAGLDEVVAMLNRDRSPALRERADFLARKTAEEGGSR